MHERRSHGHSGAAAEGGLAHLIAVPEGVEATPAAEQSALRRIATLVARGVPSDEMFDAVVREVGPLVGAHATGLLRFDNDDVVTLIAAWHRAGSAVVSGQRAPAVEQVRMVRDTGQSHRWDAGESLSLLDDGRLPGGPSTGIGIPIFVDGQVWGVSCSLSPPGMTFPDGTEARICGFVDLIATAIANAAARARVRELLLEQAARERIATLVARDFDPSALAAEVTAEVGRLLGADMAGMVRYIDASSIEAVATWSAHGDHPDVGGRWPLDGNTLALRLLQTRRPTRVDDWRGVPGPVAKVIRDVMGVRSSVGSPILVDGEVWGSLVVHSTARVMSADVEARLESFCGLVSTSIANAQARADARRLAEEQAALRRVATLIARESPPDEVLSTVAREVARILGADDARIIRHEANDAITIVAGWGSLAEIAPIGLRVPVGGDNVTTEVLRTGRSARKDYYGGVSGAVGEVASTAGVRSAVGAPIVVGGKVWGVVLAAATTDEPLAPEAETRIAEFAELAATAFSNLESRAHLAASRARLMAAADAERRRVVRDLHDGAQQRLIHTVITLKQARAHLVNGSPAAGALLEEALEQAERASKELRELARGIMPAVLTGGGLRAAVESLAERSPVHVRIGVVDDRFAPHIEATAYFVVAEALTNIAKHADASTAFVRAHVADNALIVEVQDDGRGGARLDEDRGGIVGLADRLAVLGGRLSVDSPVGTGTVVRAQIPLRQGQPPAGGAGSG